MFAGHKNVYAATVGPWTADPDFDTNRNEFVEARSSARAAGM
jgi:hypothetical protein